MNFKPFMRGRGWRQCYVGEILVEGDLEKTEQVNIIDSRSIETKNCIDILDQKVSTELELRSEISKLKF